MNGRALAVQGGLALAGLVAAYFTWQRPTELHEGEVIVLDATKHALQSVRFDDDETKTWAELTRAKDYVNVHVSARPEGPQKQQATPERWLRGSENAQRALGRFAPLAATRALGVLDAPKLKELGLDTSKKTVTVTTRAGQRRFTIAPAPPGGSDPYLRDQADGRVFVVARPILTDLQNAHTNLADRRLHGFDQVEADRVQVSLGPSKREYRASRGEGRGIILAPAAKPGSPDDSARTWHERVWTLWPAEILGRDEIPREGPPLPRLRVDYFGHGKNLGWIELAESATPTEAASTTAAKKTIYARTEFTVGWVKLSGDVQPIIDDAAKLK
jgi:hypothetical protein